MLGGAVWFLLKQMPKHLNAIVKAEMGTKYLSPTHYAQTAVKAKAVPCPICHAKAGTFCIPAGEQMHGARFV